MQGELLNTISGNLQKCKDFVAAVSRVLVQLLMCCRRTRILLLLKNMQRLPIGNKC